MSKFKVGDVVVPNNKWTPDLLKSYKLDESKVYIVNWVLDYGENTGVSSIKLEGLSTTFDAAYFSYWLSLDVNSPEYAAITPQDIAGHSKTALDKQVSGNHYKDCKIQPVEYIQANGLSYLEGNVIKYTTRHSKKNGKADIEKAIHYLELILEMEYKDK